MESDWAVDDVFFRVKAIFADWSCVDRARTLKSRAEGGQKGTTTEGQTASLEPETMGKLGLNVGGRLCGA